MIKKIMFASLVLAVVAMGGAVWAQGDPAQYLSQQMTEMKVDLAGMKGEFKAAFSYLDWEMKLIIGLVLAILGFVFYLAKEIGFGTRDRIKEIFARLQAVEEKLHLPHLPKSVLLLLLSLILISSARAAAPQFSTDDIMKAVQQLQIGQAELKAKVDILLMLYGLFVAALIGMVWALINLSKEVRIPKEERVAKLEELVGQIKEYLGEVADKLHLPRLPKSVLLLLLSLILISSAFAAIPQKINIQGKVTPPVAQNPKITFDLAGAGQSYAGIAATDVVYDAATGIFNCTLDLTNRIDSLANADATVTININGNHLITQQPLNSVPYAFKVDGLYVDNVNVGLGADGLNASNTKFMNTAVGARALQKNDSGSGQFNTAIGYSALKLNTGGQDNTAIGLEAGVTGSSTNANISGSDNTFIGCRAGPGTASQLNNATAIGANALVSASNSLVLGDNNTGVGIGTTDPGTAKLAVMGGNVGIGTTSPQAKLDVSTTIGVGIQGSSDQAIGIYGVSKNANGIGVYGYNLYGKAIYAYGATGLYASGPKDSYGIYSVSTKNYFAGNVGIGTKAPNYSLDVYGRARIQGLLSDASNTAGIWLTDLNGKDAAFVGLADETHVGFWGNNGAKWNMVMDTTSGDVGIGVRDPKANLDVNGFQSFGLQATTQAKSGVVAGVYGSSSVYGVMGSGGKYDFYALNGRYNWASSKRWKNNIKLIDNPLEKIESLRGVYFDWDKAHHGRHDMGMIAEEVGKVIPEVVGWDDDAPGYATGMDYAKLTPLLVEAIKEQQKQIEALKAEVEKLKNK